MTAKEATVVGQLESRVARLRETHEVLQAQQRRVAAQVRALRLEAAALRRELAEVEEGLQQTIEQSAASGAGVARQSD